MVLGLMCILTKEKYICAPHWDGQLEGGVGEPVGGV